MTIPLEDAPASHRPPEPSPRRPSPALWLAALTLLGLIALVIVLLATGAFGGQGTTVVEQPAAALPSGGRSAFDPAAIYARVNPGVIDITAHSTTTTSDGPFGMPRRAQVTDTGTGMVIDGRGDILTAAHVVAGATAISVTFQGGVTRTAEVRGADTATDVAVLGVDRAGLTLHPVTLGSMTALRVGDPVAVIGDPFDVQRSLSTGVISGLDRTIQAPNGFTIPSAIQTDASINPGNSGGPVLDATGQVIGIADQIDTGGSGADSSTGVGFAVSVDAFKGELSDLEAGRTPAHAFLGVSTSDATEGGDRAGALVGSVAAGGPASRAGVRAGDLIVALGAARVHGVNALVAAAARLRPGDPTTVAVIRGGRRLTLPITPAAQPRGANTGT